MKRLSRSKPVGDAQEEIILFLWCSFIMFFFFKKLNNGHKLLHLLQNLTVV